jgi:hypothetical protein
MADFSNCKIYEKIVKMSLKISFTSRKNMMDESSPKKMRCFVIADDYRWHYLTSSREEFESKTLSYLDLMECSLKENKYHIKNIFLTQKEYLQELENIMINSKKNRSKKPPPHLYLVKS